MGVIENALLRQRSYLTAKNYTDFWDLRTSTLDVSEEFVLANDFGFGKFCNGGSTNSALTWIAVNDLPIEFEQNYPYSEQNCDQDKNQDCSSYYTEWKRKKDQSQTESFLPKNGATPLYPKF